MKIIVERTIYNSNEFGVKIKSQQTLMKKEYESKVIPHKGDHIVDKAFENKSAEATSVSIDFEENECCVSLKGFDAFEKMHDVVSKYLDNKWTK